MQNFYKWLILHMMFYICSAVASENSKYDFEWLDNRDAVFVLQNKEFPKKNHFNLDLTRSDSNTSVYQNTTAFGLNLSFFPMEEIGINVYYHSYSNKNNSALDNLLENTATKPFIRRFKKVYGLGVDWIPLYGKINAFNSIFYFDWGLGLAYNKIAAESNLSTFLDGNKAVNNYESESFSGYSARSFFKFLFYKRYDLLIDYRYLRYSAQDVPGGAKKSFAVKDMSIGLGILF